VAALWEIGASDATVKNHITGDQQTASTVKKHDMNYQVPIVGPQPADAFWLDNLPTQSRMFGLPECAPSKNTI
jgi:hypothetical protein